MSTLPSNPPTQFALLYPSNRCATIAFDHVASKLKASTNWNPHARKYMAVYPLKADLEYFGSESESEGGSGPQMQKRRIWRGHYRLNFNLPPRDPRFGWVLGGGKFGPGDESPDFVLTEKKSRDGIFGRHASLFHNHSSGTLMLQLANEGLAVVDGKEVRESTVICSIVTHITLGNLTYKLELDGANDEVHRGRLMDYQLTHGLNANGGPVNLLSTPAESDYIHKDYVIKNPVGHGGSSTVFAGEHIKTGRVVAIKRIIRDEDNAHLIEQEIRMADFLGFHPCLCQMVDKMSPDGDRRSVSFRTGAFDEVYLVYSPLAMATRIPLCEERGLDGTAHNKLCVGLFRQCLEGIEFIHSKGVMHRDIKPGNLAIVSNHPIQGRVFDFGCAKIGSSSNELYTGTLPYHAPEMWEMARNSGIPGLKYDKNVDLFAFGLSAYQIFCKEPMWWGDEAEEVDLDVMEEELRTHLGAPLEITRLIINMLACNSNSRPSAIDAMKLLENSARPGNGSSTPRSAIAHGVDFDRHKQQQYPSEGSSKQKRTGGLPTV